MHFQIFIPKSNGAMDLESVGLGDLIPDAYGTDVPIGPTVKDADSNPLPLGAGKCWSWTSIAAGYYGDQAKWIPAVKGFSPDGKELPAGRYYVGILESQPPTPAELLRVKEPRFSLPLVDVDERSWLIPVAQRMPQIFFKDPEGNLMLRVHPKYGDYFERVTPFWNVFWQGGTIPPEQYWDFCLYALKQNYRITEEVADFLGLLTDIVMRQIPRIACDLDAIREEAEARERENAERGAEKNAAGGE